MALKRPAIVAIPIFAITTIAVVNYLNTDPSAFSTSISSYVTRSIVSIKSIMESKAKELLACLKNPNTLVDSKVASLAAIKSEIKQKNVPEAAITPIFESLRLAMAAQHLSLSTAGFSTHSHLLKRLYIQDYHHTVALEARQYYPLLLERLGDHKERLRAHAAQAFTELYTAAPTEVEHFVMEVAFVGKNPRAREMSMLWLITMTRERGLLFRAYVPGLVMCLEDSNGSVRDTAKSTIVELFDNAPSKAKLDLKKQIDQRNIQKTIATGILSSLGLVDHETEPKRPASVLSSRSQNETVESADMEKVSPQFVTSNRELDDIFRNMLPHFEGRETEQNWILREKSILTLRQLTHGKAPQEYSQHYLAGIKNMLDGILKAVNSLRTTLSSSGCLLLQDVAKTCGPGIDHMVEILLQNMIKLCAGMKKISAQNGNITVDAIIANVTYTQRILQHLWFACQDKNVQPRHFASRWLKTLINKQAHHKSSIEHGGGLELVEKCIKKGLSDANPGVREGMRGTFWTFHQVWPDRAANIMSDLDNKSKSLLEKDPANPHAQSSHDTPRSRPGFSSSVSAPSNRQTLKETIAAQKKRLAAGNKLPPRPESAQSTFADTKPTRPPARTPARTPAAKTTSNVRTVPTGTHLSSLSSAPMRPAVKPRRPELIRPATADPYADRRSQSARPKPKRLDISTLKSGHTEEPGDLKIPANAAISLAEEATPAPEVKVYEDPEPPASPESPASPDTNIFPRGKPSVLEELLPNHLTTPDHLEKAAIPEPDPSPLLDYVRDPGKPDDVDPEKTHRRWRKIEGVQKTREISPRSKDPVKAREMIEKGILRIRAKALDVHGYRKLQGLIKYHDTIFTDEAKYDEMLMALLDVLEDQGEYKRSPLVRPVDIKVQILVTIRLMFTHNQKYYSAYYPRIMIALLKARKQYEPNNHIVSGLEETAEDIIANCRVPDVIDAILDFFETEGEDEKNEQATIMAVHCLKGMFRRINQQHGSLSHNELERVSTFVNGLLKGSSSDIRRAAIEFCLELHQMVKETEVFWSLITTQGDHRSLLTYFIAKKEAAK